MIDENKLPTLTFEQKREVRNLIIERCFRNTYIVFFIFVCVVEYFCNDEISIFANLVLSLFPVIMISDIISTIACKKAFETEKGLNKIFEKGWIKED